MPAAGSETLVPIAIASGWSIVLSEVVGALFGVPLAVVLAATAGSFLAKHPTELTGGKAFLRRLLWIFVACVFAQGVAAFTQWMSSSATPPGAGWLGLLALLSAGLGPKGWPMLVDSLPLVFKGLLRKWLPEALPPEPPIPPPPPPPTTGGTDEPRP